MSKSMAAASPRDLDDGREATPSANSVRRFIPWMFVVLCLLFDASIFPFQQSLNHDSLLFGVINLHRFTPVLMTGVFVGQFAILALIAGLSSTRWILGFVQASLLGYCAYVLHFGSVVVSSYFDLVQLRQTDLELIASGILAVPAIVFFLGLPFWLLRGIRGWYFGAEEHDGVRVWSWNPAGLMLGVFVATITQVAMTGGVGHFAEVYSGEFWGVLGLSALAFVGGSLCGALPLCVLFLSMRRWWLRWITLTMLLVVITIATVVTLVFMHYPMLEDWWRVVVGTCSTGAVLFVGLEAYIFAGYRIRRVRWERPEAEAAAASGTASSQTTVLKSKEATSFFGSDKRVWLCSGFVFTIAVASWFARGGWAIYEFVEAGNTERVIEATRANGGQIEYHPRFSRLLHVKVPIGTSDEEFREYRRFSKTPVLDISDSEISDASVVSILSFRELKHLKLSGSQLTEAGVLELARKLPLTKLELAGIPFSGQAVRELLIRNQEFKLTHLDLSETGVEIRHLLEAGRGVPPVLGLRGLSLSDQEVATLIQSTIVDSLDLRDNELTGEFLLSIDCDPEFRGEWYEDSFEMLRLEGNPITDEAVSEARKDWLRVDELSLGENLLTDGALPDIAAITAKKLLLFDGNFSQSGLIANIDAFAGLKTLGLYGKQFTVDALRAAEQAGIRDVLYSESIR